MTAAVVSLATTPGLTAGACIGLMTPDQVHYGQTDAIHAARQNTLDGAFYRNPERFVRKQPEPPAKPIAT
jgi:putative transposase